MQFENTEMSKEDKKMLLMALTTYLGFIKREYEDNDDEEVTASCNTIIQLYEDNKEKLVEIFGDTTIEMVVKATLQNVKNLLQEF